MIPEKHIIYYKLKETIPQDGCPVCNLVNKNVKKYIENILYECVNDQSTNKSLLESNGFCQKHADILLTFKDAMGISILYERILSTILLKLENKNLKKTITTYNNFIQERKEKCPACLTEKAGENRYIEALFWHFTDLKKILSESDGLCLKHLIDFLKLADKKDRKKAEEMKKIYIVKNKNLKNKLIKLADSYNFTVKHGELSKEEKISWEKVVKNISGY